MTLAIGHVDFHRAAVTLDCIREVKPPFSPEALRISKTLAITTSTAWSVTNMLANGAAR